MKNLKVFSLLPVLFLSLAICGCSFVFNDSTTSDDPAKEIIALVSEASNLYEIEASDGGQIFDTSYDIGVYDIYYFYLGEIRDMPFKESSTLLCQAQAFTYQFEFSESSTSTVSETINRSTTRSVTYGASEQHNLKFKTGKELSSVMEFEYGISLGFSKSTLSSSSYSTSNTKTFSETISKKESISVTLSSANGFENGYSYKMLWFNTLDIYGVILYDKYEGTYSYSTVGYVCDVNPKATIIKSKDKQGHFDNWNKDDTIPFDVDSALEYVKTHTPEQKIEQDGSEKKPYLIASWDDFAESVNDSTRNKTDVYWLIVKDIAVPAYEAKDGSIFNELFAKVKGSGKTISGINLTMTSGSGRVNIGLFETIREGSSVSGLVFNDDRISFASSGGRNYSYSGILAAVNKGEITDCEFRNCTVSIDENSYNDYSHVTLGTIVGQNEGKIENCTVSSSTLFADSDTENGEDVKRATTASAGGVCGINKGEIDSCSVSSTTIEVRACYFKYGDALQHLANAGGAVGWQQSGGTCKAICSATLSAKDKKYEYEFFVKKAQETNGNIGTVIGYQTN